MVSQQASPKPPAATPPHAGHASRLRALHAAALTIAQPVPAEPAAVGELLSLIVDRAIVALDGCDGRLVLAEDLAWQELVPGTNPQEGYVRIGRSGPPRRTPVRAEGATMHAQATGEAVYVPDNRVPSRFGPYSELLRRGSLSFATVPLVSGRKVLGTLAVNFAAPGPPAQPPEEKEALEIFAAHAAAALERVRHASQARLFAATLARIGAAPGVEAALDALLRGALALLRGDAGSARLYYAHTTETSFVHRIGYNGQGETRPAWPVTPGSFAAALRDGGPSVLIEDFWALDPATYRLYDVMRAGEMRASVNVPIDAGGRRIGSLHVDHHQAAFFTQADCTMAEALASQAGAAVARAQLEAEQREARAAQSRLDGALLVARTAAHELNNALATLLGYTYRLARLPAAQREPDVARYVRGITASADDVADRVRRLEQIVRLEENTAIQGSGQPVLDLARSTALPAAAVAAALDQAGAPPGAPPGVAATHPPQEQHTGRHFAGPDAPPAARGATSAAHPNSGTPAGPGSTAPPASPK